MLENTGVPGVPEFYDYLKHLTTLSTGALVILVSLADKLSSGRGSRKEFVKALTHFLTSVTCAVVCMLFVLSGRRYIRAPPVWEKIAGFGAFFASLIFLLSGLLHLTRFGISKFPEDTDKSKPAA